MGTRIENLQVMAVVDGDTIKLHIEDKKETLRISASTTEQFGYSVSSAVNSAASFLSRSMATTCFASGASREVISA